MSKASKKSDRTFSPVNETNHILYKYWRGGEKATVLPINDFMRKLDKYNQKNGTNYSYGKAQVALFFGQIKL